MDRLVSGVWLSALLRAAGIYFVRGSDMVCELLVSLRLNLAYLRRLVDDVNDEEMVAQPRGAVNHPAWLIGHIIYSFQAMASELGVAGWLADDWSAMFGTGTTPMPSRAAYPAKKRLLEFLGDAEGRLTKVIEEMTSADLAKALPDEDYRQTLPTVGHALVHILIGHTSVHVGQLTVWRHAMGMDRAGEHFEAE